MKHSNLRIHYGSFPLPALTLPTVHSIETNLENGREVVREREWERGRKKGRD